MTLSIHNKQFWMSNAIIVASLLAAAFFPTENAIQSLISDSVFLVILPIFFVKFLLKGDLSEYGFSLGKMLRGSLWMIVLLSGIVAGLAAVIHYTDILARFAVPLSIRVSFLMFLLYLFVTGVYIFIFEFFFRGFVFFVWEKFGGMKAIAMQTLLFMLFLVAGSHGKVDILFLIAIAMAVFSGFLVAQSRSIVYSFLFSYISAILGIASAVLFVK
ncbi:MAG: hypothetical protein PHT88_02915 [Candidatus Moranbacteria bacterium]|nr:hypothetical protein [Candidatus Moranbacteria bacterium]